MTRKESYACTIERDADGRVTAILLTAIDLEAAEGTVMISSTKASRIAAAVLRSFGRQASGAGLDKSGKPIPLDPISGRPGRALVTAVKPLRRADRIGRSATASRR